MERSRPSSTATAPTVKEGVPYRVFKLRQGSPSFGHNLVLPFPRKANAAALERGSVVITLRTRRFESFIPWGILLPIGSSPGRDRPTAAVTVGYLPPYPYPLKIRPSVSVARRSPERYRFLPVFTLLALLLAGPDSD